MIEPLSSSYADARTAFLDAAAQAGARIKSFPHRLKGLEEEDLSIDVAEVVTYGPLHTVRSAGLTPLLGWNS